jgi:tRNA nucleotidyltransferase (CCA-adding enzyme)
MSVYPISFSLGLEIERLRDWEIRICRQIGSDYLPTPCVPMPNYTVILTHEHADFDALASLLGARLLFPDAIPVLPRSINRNGRAFLALYRNQLPFIEPKDMPRGHVELAILVDTRSFNSVKGMDKKTRFLVIDHHSVDEPLPEHWQTWKEGTEPYTVGANTTLLVEKLMMQHQDLSSLHATLLALGIYEDTGGLLYESTTHRDARCVAWLLEQGANLEVLSRFIKYPMSEAQQALSQKLVDSCEHLEIAGHTIIIAAAEAPEFKDEVSALAHKLRELYDPDGLFVLIDLGDHIQVVGRSTTDAVDVGKVAEALGGGGHRRAAAALVRNEDLDVVRLKVIHLTRQHTHPPVAVRQIMSRGRPQTLHPDTAVEEAAQLMRRYGHEGFPVLEEEAGGERLVGILTRRDADRAVDHKLGKRPVHKIMRTGDITIHEDASIEELHRLMIDSGWGQIPVVDHTGHLIGIVTRTDLIKLWGESGDVSEQIPDVSRQLVEVLPPIQHRLLRIAGEIASELGYSVYVVGGFVRDLLLSYNRRKNGSLDMDIVVEGDAIALVQRMQEIYGGRVVTHQRFGTAKWILNEPDDPLLVDKLLQSDIDIRQVQGGIPPHLDFITARTEFYTEPTVLPTVVQGSIKLDLHRRDFTLNTLAIVLAPDRWGELLDFYGGLSDLRQGLIRVLHSLSFVDDPTRILRAVRYEQRFDFMTEPRTLELLYDAVELISRVTPARIRHELERILEEEQPEKALQRLDELGVLAAIHPQLHAGDWIEAHFTEARRRQQEQDPLAAAAFDAETGEPLVRLYWGLLVYPMLPATEPRPEGENSHPKEADDAVAERLALRGETRQLMRKLRYLKSQCLALEDPSLPPSQIVAILDTARPATLFLLSVVEENTILQERLQRYMTEWRQVQPSITGADLRSLGLKPSPLYGKILRRLRAALLDGEITPGEAERQMVAEIIEAEGG